MARLSASQHTGMRGEAFVAKTTVDAGFIWNDLRRDFGIDGQIEVVDEHGIVTGATVLTQVKSTAAGFVGQDGMRRILCEKEHIAHWMRCDRPVVIVLVDIATQSAVWKRVDHWFRDPLHRA